ncbi:AbiH family protein [Flavobacterium denitrificans]|uniref:AbiH family protein n=1 Tax=Flavobacterium denitrificans TaxID=281361 RepID=UPI0004200E7E|nr:AbiH family protein [Flavobacterium denitrificans]
MSKILITGNGFDLFHNLPTKYHHFISIMQTIEKNQFREDVSFDNLFGGIFKNKFTYDFNSIVENYKIENLKFEFDKINRLKELVVSNLWYKYSKNVLEIDTWIDFEVEIETILNQLIIFEKYSDKTVVNKNTFRDPLIKFTDFQLFGIVRIIDTTGLFTINDRYINKRKNIIEIKIILEDLAKSFEEFIMIFNRYLVDIVSTFYKEIKEKYQIPFQFIDEIYTFNYTPTLEDMYGINNSKVTYLHGQVNEDCLKQNIVMGISELPQDIKINKMFDFTKYYQKVNKNANKKFIEIPKTRIDETVFYIFGHSLDESDKEYIIDLFKFLEFDDNMYSKICVFYYNENDKNNKWRNLFNIIDKNVLIEMNKKGRLYFSNLNVENINKEFSKELQIYKIVF